MIPIIKGFAVVVAVLLATASSAQAKGAGDAEADGGRDCVTTAEWSDLQNGLDSPNGGARRSVVEQSWDVVSIGYRNEYWIPADSKTYSLAYNFCQNHELLIVLVYRKSSGAWQYAIKGGLLPVG